MKIIYIENRGKMRKKIADIHSTHGWHVGLECAEQILTLLKEEIEKKFREIEGNPCSYMELKQAILGILK